MRTRSETLLIGNGCFLAELFVDDVGIGIVAVAASSLAVNFEKRVGVRDRIVLSCSFDPSIDIQTGGWALLQEAMFLRAVQELCVRGSEVVLCAPHVRTPASIVPNSKFEPHDGI